MDSRRRVVPEGAPAGRRCPCHCHLVGVGGAGMTALAELLVGCGWRVSGSDLRATRGVQRLARAAGPFFLGHSAEQVPAETTVLVHSAAIGPENPERLEAARRGIPQYSYGEMLGRLMQGGRGMCIAGTHGKSTTAAMCASMLTDAGFDPSVAVGAEVLAWQTSGRAGDGEWFVAEACEYRRSFLHLHPSVAVVLGIEPDHFDCYPALAEAERAYGEFVGKVPDDGLVLARGDCEATGRAVGGAHARIERFSLEPGFEWWAADLRSDRGRYRFRVFRAGAYHVEVKLGIPGRHHVLNALAAIAAADFAGVPGKVVRDALEEFRGTRRRFQKVGHWRGATLVDDYAHHPTAVRATLATAREVFGRRRLWCVFQPHQASRTFALLDEFAASFDQADRLVLCDVYGAREDAGGGQVVAARQEPRPPRSAGEASRLLWERVRVRHPEAARVGTPEEAVEHLDRHLEPGDVVVSIGAGDIERVCDAFTRRLQRDHAGQRATRAVHLSEDRRPRRAVCLSA